MSRPMDGQIRMTNDQSPMSNAANLPRVFVLSSFRTFVIVFLVVQSRGVCSTTAHNSSTPSERVIQPARKLTW